MIKVSGNKASREPIPEFLYGLTAESLSDLSWTDPNLGVSECMWWPEEDQSPPLGEFERYTTETLKVDKKRKVVVVIKEIEPWSDEEITRFKKSLVPEKVTMRQARLALYEAGLLSKVQQAIDELPEPPRMAAQIEWDYSGEMYRNREFVNILGQKLGLTEEDIDELFVKAAKI